MNGTVDGSGPQMIAHVRRPPAGDWRRLVSLSNVTVDAQVYSSDVSSSVITNEIIIAVPVGPYKATVPLSNVVPGNNEFATLKFTGNAPDGSKIALGELGGLVNVTGSTTNTSTLTEKTTQTFQAFLDLAENGALSTYDVDHVPTLSTELLADIAGFPVDPTTHLFTSGTLQAVYKAAAPKFARNMILSGSPATNGSSLFVRDYTKASELNWTSNLQSFFGNNSLAAPIPIFNDVIAGGTIGNCGSFDVFTPGHAPTTNPLPLPQLVTSCLTDGIGTVTVRNIYGGNILVGTTNNRFNPTNPSLPPYKGGFIAFAGHAPGTFPVTVPTASTQLLVPVNDPAGFAFGAPFYSTQPPFLGAFYTKTSFGLAPLSVTSFLMLGGSSPSRVLVPTPYSATSNKLTVDTFSPFYVGTANTQICGGITCWTPGTTPPPIQRPFADAGSNLSYRGWMTSNKATSIVQNVSGYNITISGAGTATLTSNTPSVFLPRQRVMISSSLFAPSTWTLTATDAASNIYSDSAFGTGAVTIQMNSVGSTVVTKSTTLSFTTSAPGTVLLQSITTSF